MTPQDPGCNSSNAPSGVSGALKGRWVSFRVEDSFLPSPVDLLLELHRKDRLAGEVIDVSDDGSDEGVFVVVRVPEVVQPVVVRADRLLGAT